MIVQMFVKSLGNCPWSVCPLFQDTASSSASENDGAGGGGGGEAQARVNVNRG